MYILLTNRKELCGNIRRKGKRRRRRRRKKINKMYEIIKRGEKNKTKVIEKINE